MRIEVAVPSWLAESSYVMELEIAAGSLGLMLMREGGQPVDFQITHVVETGNRRTMFGTPIEQDQYVRLSAVAYKP